MTSNDFKEFGVAYKMEKYRKALELIHDRIKRYNSAEDHYGEIGDADPDSCVYDVEQIVRNTLL